MIEEFLKQSMHDFLIVSGGILIKFLEDFLVGFLKKSLEKLMIFFIFSQIFFFAKFLVEPIADFLKEAIEQFLTCPLRGI